MLPHYLMKIKVEICDKLRMSLFDETKHVRQTRQTLLLSCLQHLLEMFAFCPYTCSKMLTPPVNCIVNDAVVHDVPNIQQTLLQFVNAVQLRLMHSLLDITHIL